MLPDAAHTAADHSDSPVSAGKRDEVRPVLPDVTSLLQSLSPVASGWLPSSVDAGLLAVLTPALNHVLAADAAACAILGRSAGKSVALEMAPLRLVWSITAEGLLRAVSEADFTDGTETGLPDTPDVTITLQMADVPVILQDTRHAMSYVRIAGDAELASKVAQVGQTVRWDAEKDVSRLVGDIAAVRLVDGIKSLAGATHQAATRLTQAAVEFLTEEKPVLATHWQMETFRKEIAHMRDDTERLLKRFDKLKARVKV